MHAQATLYKMAQRIIDENAHITSVSYKLPNKHYVPVDMKYIGVDNMSPCVLLRRVCVSTMALTHSCSPKAEVFVPLSAPRYVSLIRYVAARY